MVVNFFCIDSKSMTKKLSYLSYPEFEYLTSTMHLGLIVVLTKRYKPKPSPPANA